MRPLLRQSLYLRCFQLQHLYLASVVPARPSCPNLFVVNEMGIAVWILFLIEFLNVRNFAPSLSRLVMGLLGAAAWGRRFGSCVTVFAVRCRLATLKSTASWSHSRSRCSGWRGFTAA